MDQQINLKKQLLYNMPKTVRPKQSNELLMGVGG